MLPPCLSAARAARIALGLLSLSWLTSPSRAADVTYNGYIETSVTHSDNLDLEPKGQESSGLIFTQDVGLGMRAVGAHSDVAVNGSVKLDNTVGDKNDVNLRPDVVALGRTELANGFLLLDGGMSWRREPLTPDAGLSASTGFNTEETTQVANINFSPTLRSRFGDNAKGELRYRFARNFIASDAVRETVINQQVAVLQSDRPLYPYRLTLTGEHTTSDQLGGNEDLRQLSGALRTEYAFSPRIALIGIAGYDDIGAMPSSLALTVRSGRSDCTSSPIPEPTWKLLSAIASGVRMCRHCCIKASPNASRRSSAIPRSWNCRWMQAAAVA